MCSTLRRGASPHAAAQACGLGSPVLESYLRKGEASVMRGEQTCYASFFAAFMLALAASPVARRYLARDAWARRYWVAVGHAWCAGLCASP